MLYSMKLTPIRIPPFFIVLTMLITVSPQLHSAIAAGDGSQYCMSADGLISESECNPSYVPPNDSPLLPDGINLVKKEESHGGTNVTLMIYDVLQNYVATSTSFIHRCFLQKLSLFVLPALYGLLMVLFSWLLVFYDSKVPGVFPPTPLSPKKHRVRSGHTFHLSYTIGLINGIMVFGMSLWNQLH